MAVVGEHAAPLSPYLPRLVGDWIRDHPDQLHREMDVTCVFADISGFTALTERLAAAGKLGAEELGDVLNTVFAELLGEADAYGGSLVKWGGDGVLLLFSGAEHAVRAARAAWEMQAAIRRVGQVRTSAGAARLRMSIGIHSGHYDFLLVGSCFRELVACGPAVSTVAATVEQARAGEVRLTAATAARLPARIIADPGGAGFTAGTYLLTGAPAATRRPAAPRPEVEAPPEVGLCAPLREHLASGAVDHEHRLVTVAFLQCQGVDALRASTDAVTFAATLDAVLSAVQEAAEQYGVTILSTDVCEDGFKVILASGAPVAVGDDQTRVLSAALKAVRHGGLLPLRAGVTTGRVFAGAFGSAEQRVYSIIGDDVNLAARLMSHAEPGQLITVPAVVQLARPGFRAIPMAPLHVKGKASPVNAVIVEQAGLGVETPLLPLIGRHRELETLSAAATRAAAGTGDVVRVVGDPGIGKSRLVSELRARSEVPVIWMDGDIYASTTAYEPLRPLLAASVGLPPTIAPQVLVRALARQVANRCPDLQPYLALLAAAGGGAAPSTPELDRLDQRERKERLEQTVTTYLERTLTTPVVIVFNDLQFMDSATRDLLAELARDVGRRPWLIVVSHRPDLDPRLPGSVLDLSPLALDDAAALLAGAAWAADVPAKRIDEVLTRAGGNPLYLQALIATVRTGSDLQELPAAIDEVIAVDIDRLAPPVRRWLRQVSVLGMSVNPRLLADMGIDPDLTADPRLVDFIRPGDDGRLHFSHQLVQQAAYAGLPFRQRVALHRRAAAAIEQLVGGETDAVAGLLSLHYSRAGEHSEAWEWSRRAADLARERYLLVEAAELYERALDARQALPGHPDAEAAEAAEQLSRVADSIGDLTLADSAARRGRAWARDSPLLFARLCRRSAVIRHQQGRQRAAAAWTTRGRAALAGRSDPDSLQQLARLASLRAMVSATHPRPRSARRWATIALAEATACGDPAVLAEATATQAAVRAQTGDLLSVAEADDLVALAERSGSPDALAFALNAALMVFYVGGVWPRAIEVLRRQLSAELSAGKRNGSAMTQTNLAEILVLQGRLPEAEPLLADALAIFEESGGTSYAGTTLMVRAQLELERGAFTEAIASAEASRRIAHAGAEQEYVGLNSVTIAEAQIALGQLDAAAENLREAEARLARGTHPRMRFASVWASLALMRGDIATGEATLRATAEEASTLGNLYETHRALQALLMRGLGTTAERGQWVQTCTAIGRKLDLLPGAGRMAVDRVHA